MIVTLFIVTSDGIYAQNCIRLGGSKTCIKVVSQPVVQLPQYTIECWFKREATGIAVSTGNFSAIPLVTKGRNETDGNTTDINYFLGIKSINDVICADFEDGGSSATPGKNHPLIGTTRIFNNVWYHAAVTLSSTKFSLYLNGNLEAQTTITTTPQTGGVQALCIGSAMNSANVPAGSFIGCVSEVRLWNVAKSSLDLLSNLFSRGLTSSSMVARWSMNDNSGIAPADSSGKGINSIIEGSNFSWVNGSPFTDQLSLLRDPYIQEASSGTVSICWRTNIPSTGLIRYSTNWQVLPDLVADENYSIDHKLTLTKLLPGKKYYYQVGATTKVLQRDTNNSFVVYPQASSPSSTVAWITGDVGTGTAVSGLVYNALKNDLNGSAPDVWINAGNQAYNSGSDNDYQSRFFSAYAGTLKKSCFWPVPGVIDYDSSTTRQDDHIIPYNSCFFPYQSGQTGVSSARKEYYSFDHGDVHFICLDVYGEEQNKRLYDTTSAQVLWLKNDLALTTKKWKVVCLAMPPYTKGSLNSDTDTALAKIRENIVPILERYNVDLVVSGGSIAYERSYLLAGHTGNASSYKTSKHRLSSSKAKYDGSANSCPYVKLEASGKGTVYVVVGSSGKRGSSQQDYPYPAMAYSNVNKAGALVLNVRQNRLDAKWLREDGVVSDQFTFVKNVNDTIVMPVNSNQSVELKAPWSGNYYWTNNGSTSNAQTVSVTGSSYITVRDSLNCFARTFQLSLVGQDPMSPVLVAPSNGNCCVAGPANLQVNVTDPNGSPLSVSFYGRLKPASSNPPPPFTIMGVPDTQFYTGEVRGGQNAVFKSQLNWIVSHKDSLNIAFVAHYGDCVENGDNGGNDIEWKRADTSLKIIENPITTSLPFGLPYSICVGNHDQTPNGDPNGTTTFYNQYFGSSRFTGRSYYGGHYGSNNDNHYELFSVQGYDFIVISLEYDLNANSAVLSWADNLLKTYSSRIGIICSHYLLEVNSVFGAQGLATYNYLKGNPNLMLMLCGHNSGEAQRTDVYNGKKVITLLSDYQTRLNGGTGWMNILQFFPAENKLKVKTYTPVYNIYETDQNSEFSMDMDLYSEFKLLGTSTGVTSGTNASFNWPLSSAGVYEWYVKVSDGVNTITGPTWNFTVTTPTPRVSDIFKVEQKMRIIPNPAKDRVRIETTPGLKEKPVIFSLDGRKLLVGTMEGMFDITDLPNGTYLIRALLTDGSAQDAKFVKE